MYQVCYKVYIKLKLFEGPKKINDHFPSGNETHFKYIK